VHDPTQTFAGKRQNACCGQQLQGPEGIALFGTLVAKAFEPCPHLSHRVFHGYLTETWELFPIALLRSLAYRFGVVSELLSEVSLREVAERMPEETVW